MRFLARLAMAASWLVIAVGFLLELAAGLAGQVEVLYDLADLPVDLPAPPGWSVAALAVAGVVTLAALALVYWRFHHVLRAATANDFGALARHIGGAGTGLVLFWVAFQAVTRGAPALMVLHVAPETRPEMDWFLLDLDIIFLVLAVVLWALASSLRKAAEIDDENRHFL